MASHLQILQLILVQTRFFLIDLESSSVRIIEFIYTSNNDGLIRLKGLQKDFQDLFATVFKPI